MSAELESVMGQYGITPTVSAGYSGDTQDLPVYIGGETAPPPRPKGGLLERAAGDPFGKLADKATGRMKGKPSTKLSSQLEKDFYSMDREDRAVLQKRLYAGGFYGNTDPNGIILGIPDETSFKAYTTAVGRAGAYFASGVLKTLDDVLDEAAGIQAQIDAAGGGRGGGSGLGRDRAPLTVELSNPDDLRRISQKVATSTLGRALTDDEVAKFVAGFQGVQHSTQSQAYGVDETGGTVVAPPAADTAAETFARRADPTAAGGQDFFRTFSAFRRILGEA